MRFKIITALFLIFFTPAFLFSQEPEQAQESEDQNQENQEKAANTGPSDQQISDFSLAGYGEKGKKTWDLAGKSADIFTDTVKLTDVIGNLYGKEENIKLTADKGDFNKTNGKVHLEKNVVITTTSGTKLTTDSLDWDRKEQVVSTPDRVNIQRSNMVTEGTGALGHMNLNQVSLQKDVRVDILPQADSPELANPKDKVIITCDGALEVDYGKNIATFNKNVKVDRGDSQIYSDLMDIYFITQDKDKDKAEEKPKKEEPASGKEEPAPGLMGSKIDKIVARGNVKVVRGDNISYSDEAVYTAMDKKIILTGKPKLILNSMEDLKNASFGN